MKILSRNELIKAIAEARNERDQLHGLLWKIIDAKRIPATRMDGTDRMLVDLDPALLDEAANAIGYDEQGQ